MTPTISLTVSVLALLISAATAWLTLFRKGKVRMTQPTIIFFGHDGGPVSDDLPLKVFLRTLLYATSKRGRIIEGMFVRLRRGETAQNFNIWAYGDKNLVRGSGLFVPETGVSTNHHFLLPADGTSFLFLAGTYTMEVFASVVGERSPRQLYSIQIEVTPEQAVKLKEPEEGVYFDWGPDSGKYHSHIRSKPKRAFPDLIEEL